VHCKDALESSIFIHHSRQRFGVLFLFVLRLQKKGHKKDKRKNREETREEPAAKQPKITEVPLCRHFGRGFCRLVSQITLCQTTLSFLSLAALIAFHAPLLQTQGKDCTFSHDGPVGVIHEVCKFFKSNSCVKGDACPFVHDLSAEPCKDLFRRGRCAFGDKCKFSHDPDVFANSSVGWPPASDNEEAPLLEGGVFSYLVFLFMYYYYDHLWKLDS
jgi:hypothetical protein